MPRNTAVGRLSRLAVCSDSSRPAVAASLPRLSVGLQDLPRDYDGGPITEVRARKAKLAFFERQCSWVGDRLYVASEAVARSRDILADAGITHVVNCVVRPCCRAVNACWCY